MPIDAQLFSSVIRVSTAVMIMIVETKTLYAMQEFLYLLYFIFLIFP
jgi:hypothetical protein